MIRKNFSRGHSIVRRAPSRDSFVNFAARLGWGADNMMSQSTYSHTFITRNRTLLEAMYRGSWIIGQIVDVVAEDMTKAGIDIQSDLKPDQIEVLSAAMRDLQLWSRLCSTLKWSRLFGGAIAVMMIDGQDVATPLRLETIGKGQFKGLLVLDRWLIDPSMEELITEFGPNLGKPKFYKVVAGSQALPAMKVHHTRALRLDGIELPYWQMVAENGWSESCVERVFDRLVAFDSATAGAAQLVFKAHLRTYAVPQLRDLIATGGKAYDALLKQIEMIRMYQSNEGMTLMDSEDKYEAHNFSFAGLSDILLQFGQQLSGATGIPLVRLFGQSPAGLNSTGESDLRTYYDGISKSQENMLRNPVTVLLDVLCRSVLGQAAPKGFTFEFNDLWQMDAEKRGNIAKAHSDTVLAAFEAALVDGPTALKELRQLSRITGVWSNITDEDIERAAAAPPLGEGAITPEIQAIAQAAAASGIDPATAQAVVAEAAEELGVEPGSQPLPATPMEAVGQFAMELNMAEVAAEANKLDQEKIAAFVSDAGEFKEEDHPRKDNGEFGKGGGSPAPKEVKYTSADLKKLDNVWEEYANGNLIKEASRGTPVKEGDLDLSGHKVTSEEAEELNRAAEVLQHAAESSTTAHNVLYRGQVFASREEADVPKVNSWVEMDSLTATSANRDFAEKYMDPQFIGQDNGFKVLYRLTAAQPQKGYDRASEDGLPETILPRGAKYLASRVLPMESGDGVIIDLYQSKRKAKE